MDNKAELAEVATKLRQLNTHQEKTNEFLRPIAEALEKRNEHSISSICQK